MQPQGRYAYCTNIPALIFGMKDQSITLFHDFECEVDVACCLSGDGFDLTTSVTDVLVDGVSLRHGDALAQAVRLKIMELADAEMEAGGELWDRVCADEGLSLTGHPGDPDTHWRQVA